jgi:translation initiation factor 3 subunit B
MKLLDRRSLSAEGIHEFQWSPTANVLAYWAPEVGNAPAHVDLVEIPSRKFLRQKNLFNVAKCSMVWQQEGHYLGVKVTRHTKSKKTLYNNLELFRLNEPNVPVEMLDIKDAVMAFVWEPRGTRFALIHAENPSSTKVNVSFYDMMKKNEVAQATKKVLGGGIPGGKKSKAKKAAENATTFVAEVNLIETLEAKQCNCLFWSPAGGVIIMASLGESASGTLEFYDVDDKSLVVKEHYRSNAVMWDPSGRTVASVVSQPIEGGHFKFAMDNGYMLWTFQGKQIVQQSFETFYQFEWRPREKLLSTKEIKKVKQNLKQYEKEFDKADKERSRKLKLEATKEKRALRSKFRNRIARLREFRRSQKPIRMELLGGYDSEDEANYTIREVVLETILDEKEKIYTS